MKWVKKMANSKILKIILKAFFIFVEAIIDAIQDEMGGAENGEADIPHEVPESNSKGVGDI